MCSVCAVVVVVVVVVVVAVVVAVAGASSSNNAYNSRRGMDTFIGQTIFKSRVKKVKSIFPLKITKSYDDTS